jgi:hypothetical protein
MWTDALMPFPSERSTGIRPVTICEMEGVGREVPAGWPDRSVCWFIPARISATDTEFAERGENLPP